MFLTGYGGSTRCSGAFPSGSLRANVFRHLVVGFGCAYDQPFTDCLCIFAASLHVAAHLDLLFRTVPTPHTTDTMASFTRQDLTEEQLEALRTACRTLFERLLEDYVRKDETTETQGIRTVEEIQERRLDSLTMACEGARLIDQCIAYQVSIFLDEPSSLQRATLRRESQTPAQVERLREERALDARVRRWVPAKRRAGFRGQHCESPDAAYRQLAALDLRVLQADDSDMIYSGLLRMAEHAEMVIKNIESEIRVYQPWTLEDRERNKARIFDVRERVSPFHKLSAITLLIVTGG